MVSGLRRRRLNSEEIVDQLAESSGFELWKRRKARSLQLIQYGVRQVSEFREGDIIVRYRAGG